MSGASRTLPDTPEAQPRGEGVIRRAPQTAAAPEVVVALDFGSRRIGVAVGDSLTGTARPRAAIQIARGASFGESHLAALAAELRELGAARVVVGLPLNTDGSESALAAQVRKFAAELRGRLRLPVHTVDERYSSLEATERLRAQRRSGTRRQRVDAAAIDSAAAAVILERWFAGEGRTSA